MVSEGPIGPFLWRRRSADLQDAASPQALQLGARQDVMLGSILDRARRLLGEGEPETAIISADPDTIGDVVVALVRPDLDRFAGALAASLDPHMPRPDSPALLAGALATAIDRIGGQGRPVVTRSPAGLYTPEYWHVRINGADARSRSILARLVTSTDLN
jgi:hypothetical protein